MSLYSAIQFISVSFLYNIASNFGDFQVSFDPDSSLIDTDIFLVSLHWLARDIATGSFQ